MRPSKLKNYMDIAETVAQRSHDTETQVGTLLVNNKTGAIIATGYNGFVRGALDEILPNKRPEKYEYILHGEMNLLTNCARHGISMDDCFLISTMSPCKLCMRLMINSGVTKVVAKELYRDFEEILKMQDVEVVHVENADGFYDITYKPRTKKYTPLPNVVECNNCTFDHGHFASPDLNCHLCVRFSRWQPKVTP